MSTSAPAGYRAYWSCFAREAGPKLWLAVGLMVAIGLLEASGLLMLVPLLRALGLEEGATAGNGVSSMKALLDHRGATLGIMLAIFIGIKTAQALLRAASGMLNARIESDFVCALRDRFYRSLVQAGWLRVARERSSDLTQTLLGELPRVGVGTRQSLALLSGCILAVVQVAVAVALSPAMTVFALGSGAIVGWGLRRLRRRSRALGREGHDKRGEMASAVSEHLAGLKLAKSHGRESLHFDHFRQTMHELADRTLRLQRLNAFTSVWLEVGAVVALGAFVYFAVHYSHVPTAQLLVLVFVFTRLLGQATRLQDIWQQIAQTLPSFESSERLRLQLDAAAEPPGPPDGARLALTREIRLERVSFLYDPTRPDVSALRAIDLVVPAGTVVALCGHSGAGKSTLADILLGLLAPTAGCVSVDGAPLDAERLHAWRQSIGYVPQETFLFHETVRKNLLWARMDASEADLRDALRAAAAEEFVDRLPHGLDTVVGDRGVRLSGGERQRIALARALLRRPALLVLDEATSALDTPNELLVQEAVARLRGQLTIVLIAHRLSTVRIADRIVVLEKGAIVETGTWNELSRREGGHFRKLLAAATDDRPQDFA